MLDQKGFTAINTPNDAGCNALHLAAFGGHRRVCQLFLETKAFTGLNSKDKEEQTVLHKAVLGDHLNIVDMLIHGDVTANKFKHMDAADKVGNTAMHIAAQHGNAEIVKA